LTTAEEIARSLPAGYELQHTSSAWLAARRDTLPSLEQAGYGLDSDGVLSTSELVGRTPLLEIVTPNGILLVRRFSHGGLLRGLTGSRFGEPARPFRELCVSAALAANGVRTPEVVAARARRARGFGWRLDLVTQRVEDTIDLGRILAMARRGEVDRSALRRTATAAGAMVGRLHALGFLHADLTPSNMLVERASLSAAKPNLWIVDLQDGRFVEALGDAARRDNLRRLLRFVERREDRFGRALARTDYARFMLSYDPDRARWKEDWRGIQRAHARNRFWHGLGWMLERWGSRSVDPRERGAGDPAHPGDRA
jgi:tRNA A-37 threonylcarbamoyl transferase component Bud32